MILLWDIPEYSGTDDEEEDKLQRPDGKVTMKQLKKIIILYYPYNRAGPPFSFLIGLATGNILRY